MKLLLLLGGLLLTDIIQIVTPKASEQVQNPCVGVKSCGKCLGVSPKCAWCAESESHTTLTDRCDLLEKLTGVCSPESIFNPQNNLTFDQNKALQDGSGQAEAIQIQPQVVTIKIRPNEPQTFRLKFQLAANYPVDLYYLMDLSNSMKDDKNNLARLGSQIADSMSKITKNFRLGFGSFVDKVVMPFVSTVPAKLEHPCDGCAAPYSFINQMKLSHDTNEFVRSVRAALVSGNLDAPEGGFDAIMQAVMCKDQIGWRNVSRKLLLFCTDAGFHFAGDGKLGGIVKPNDGQCHLTHNKYTEAENQDYPSVSQISNKIREKSINVIFAVTKDQISTYEQLSTYIEGSEATQLAGDSSNIVEVIKNNYERITSKVQLNTRRAENITVKFMTNCKESGEKKESNICEGLSIGDKVAFDVTVSVSNCPTDSSKLHREFEIYPVGLAEKLLVRLDLICECDCEKQGQKEVASPKCNGNGTFECGKCTCDQGRHGKNCECDGSQSTSDEYLAACIAPNSTKNAVCSGKGECVCGTCECFQRRQGSQLKFSGKYCSCDDFTCAYFNSALCGGHGRCDCGVCKCDEGYSGEACNCPESNITCLTVDGVECNGVGVCECGVCKCNSTSSYKGPTCEECPTCPGKCTKNKNCALCKGFSAGPYTKEECDQKCTHVTLVDDIDEEEVKKHDDINFCQFNDDEDDCRYFFTYKYVKNNEVEVEVQKTKVCPTPVNVLAIVLGTIGSIVILGVILLLIWKLYTSIHDRREFAKFEKETQNAKWETGNNPLYNPATTTFQNPAFGKKEQ